MHGVESRELEIVEMKKPKDVFCWGWCSKQCPGTCKHFACVDDECNCVMEEPNTQDSINTFPSKLTLPCGTVPPPLSGKP